MVLNDVSRQTGVLVGTLRYHADKLFGRRSGDFTDDEIASILGELKESTAALAKWRTNCSEPRQNQSETRQNQSETRQNQSETRQNQSLCLPKIENELILMVDRVLEMKLPYWKHLSDHLKILHKFLRGAQQKGYEQYVADARLFAQLEKEYNEWVDSQLMGDEEGFNHRLEKDLLTLEQM